MKLESVIHPERFRILVAIGNDDLRQSLVDSLAPAGYILEEVRGEREALDVARQRKFDLVLPGLNLAETSGIEVCLKLRAREPRMRIAMAVAENRPEYEQAAL